MPLQPGTRLGVYEITGALGAGGMGEVYRARDTKLNRDVAIKILPAHLAGDVDPSSGGTSAARTGNDRMARFEREAQVLASLNHPHIAQIYGVEESGPSTGSGQAAIRAIVMELVEGEDLAARIARGPIPVDEALPLARQIAEALEAAHEIGVIHRDLKPANIKVRADGTIKVLDFGLAKAVNPDASSSANPMQSPTLTANATAMGMILGTAAYMAPEQARGKVVDRRADVWAFGCVLYEMLAGRRTFASGDVTDTLTAVLRDPPDWNQLPPNTPAAVRSLLARCLDKDPKQRLRDIGEARVALTNGSALSAAAAFTAPPAPPTRRRWLIWGAAAVLTAAAAGLGAFVASRARPAGVSQVHKTYVALRPDGSSIRSPVLSPDGRKIVYAARSRLWLQSLDEWEPRELAGTEGGGRPFWSPASDWIGFFRSEQLLKVPAAGGPVVRIASLPAVQAPLLGSSAIWTENGTILLSQAAGPKIYRVAGSGGELQEHYSLPEAMGFDLHDLAALPGGAIVMAVHRADGVGALAVLANGKATIVLEASNVANPQYSPSGHLVFARSAPNAGLWAVPFSTSSAKASGEPFLIGRGTEPSLSRDGTLVFLGAEHEARRQLAWFTMDGRVGDTIAQPQEWIEGVAISPDGRRVVASANDGLWSYDLAGGARSRVTNGRSDMTPQWVGKSGQLTFVRTVNGAPTLFLKRADGIGEEQALVDNARFPTVTADGRRIVFNRRPAGQQDWQVAWLDVDRPTELLALGPAHSGARFPAVSPDGRLVAYVSGEIGNDEIFLSRFPSGEGKWQLSTGGGGWCRFTPRGDAVVYRAPGGDLMSVPVALGDDVKIGPPRKLFEWGAGWMLFYELSPDGTRGIAAVPVGKANDLSSLSLVQNWHAEFAGR